MAETLTATLAASVSVNHAIDSDLGLRIGANGQISYSVALSKGEGSNKAEAVVELSGTIAHGARADIDLSGTLTDLFARTVAFTKIKAILFKNVSTLESEITLGGGTDGAGTAAFDTWLKSAAGGGAGDGSECLRFPKGAFTLLGNPEAGWAVTGTTADILSLKNEDGSDDALYEIAIVGEIA